MVGTNVASRSAVRRIALAKGLSGTGSGIANVALSYLVFQRTNSALWLAGTLFFSFGVVGLLTPFAGKLVDRYDRRQVMIASDVGSLLTWSLLAFAREPLAIAAIGFVASVLAVPVGLAANAAVPNLVEEEEDLAWANGLIAAAANAARLVGPAIGGGLYALGGAPLAFIINAASFGASALLVSSVRGRSFSAERAGEEPSGGSLEGFRVIRRDRMLLWITVAWTMMWLAMNVAYVADPPLARGFGVGPLGFGLIDTSFGAGALLGSLLAARFVLSARRWVAAGMLGVAAGWGMIALTPWFSLVLLGSAIAAGLDAIGTVAGYGLIQRRTPDAVRGRVFAAQSAAGLSANMVGFVIVGPLVESLGPQAVYGLGGIVSVFATLAFVIPTRVSEVTERSAVGPA
jgi:MFS family permease